MSNTLSNYHPNSSCLVLTSNTGYPGLCFVASGTAVPGGGGGFLQAQVLVASGELLSVMVGGGGGKSQGEVGGVGGFNGGQAGDAWLRVKDAHGQSASQGTG